MLHTGARATDRGRAALPPGGGNGRPARGSHARVGERDGGGVLHQARPANVGLTAEAALERPFKGRYSYLTGLGAAYVDEVGGTRGEGVLRLGLSRRLTGDGWYARLEVRLPFDIGLPDSGLNRQVIGLDIGNRSRWRNLKEIGSPFGRWRSNRNSGRIEGTVLREGSGQRGLRVLVNGRPRAVTGADGKFVVRGVPVGRASVTLDLRTLEPGYEMVDDTLRQVDVTPRSVSSVDFRIDRFSTLQGAMVFCEEDRVGAVIGARLTLASDGLARTAGTSSVGGFLFDRLPPGLYVLSVDPDTVGSAVPLEELPILEIDLREEIFGYVLRIGCPVGPDEADPRVRLLSPAPPAE